MTNSPKLRVFNAVLAQNMEKLRKGRSVGGLRDDMAKENVSIGTGTLVRLIDGDEGVRVETLSKVASYFGIDVENLLRGEASPFVEVLRVDVSFSAGPGCYPGIQEQVGSLSFRKDFLTSCGATTESARIVNVSGTSMEPTILDGAVLLINTKNTEPRSNAVFALARPNEGLVVKRLVKIGEYWFARSDNPDGNPDFRIDDGEPVTIIGRAVWMGVKL